MAKIWPRKIKLEKSQYPFCPTKPQGLGQCGVFLNRSLAALRCCVSAVQQTEPAARTHAPSLSGLPPSHAHHAILLGASLSTQLSSPGYAAAAAGHLFYAGGVCASVLTARLVAHSTSHPPHVRTSVLCVCISIPDPQNASCAIFPDSRAVWHR